jgi:hypothetical protein
MWNDWRLLRSSPLPQLLQRYAVAWPASERMPLWCASETLGCLYNDLNLLLFKPINSDRTTSVKCLGDCSDNVSYWKWDTRRTTLLVVNAIVLTNHFSGDQKIVATRLASPPDSGSIPVDGWRDLSKTGREEIVNSCLDSATTPLGYETREISRAFNHKSRMESFNNAPIDADRPSSFSCRNAENRDAHARR